MAATGSLSSKSSTQRKRPRGRQVRKRIASQITDGAAWSNWEYEEVNVAPSDPTHAQPGSEEKVRMMAARYASGLPLWHREDCVEHNSEVPSGDTLTADPLVALDLAQARSSRQSKDESRAQSFSEH